MLFRSIMTPSAVLTMVFGAWLWIGYGITGKWLMWKLFLVLALVVFHALCWRHMMAFRTGNNLHTERYFRVMNELPVLALFAIVFLVVIKPF